MYVKNVRDANNIIKKYATKSKFHNCFIAFMIVNTIVALLHCYLTPKSLCKLVIFNIWVKDRCYSQVVL